jgi:hypothetical protein
MADAGTGMEKAEMKTLLKRATIEKPVRFAFAMGTNNSLALLILDKQKQPRALGADLEKKFPDAKNMRFGEAFNGAASEDEDSKLVKFRVNKPITAMARRLVKTLKGTGFTRVEIILEDGTAVESEEEADEQQPASGTAKSTDGVPPPPPPPPPEAQKPDPAELQRQLAALIPKIPVAAAADPTRLDTLKKLAVDATTNLKTGNLVYAATVIAQLAKALEGVAAGPSTTTPPPTAPTQPQASPSGPVAYGKARLAWLGVRKKMESDVEKLKAEILAHYAGNELVNQLGPAYAAKVAPILASLDESLADKLDEAINAEDPKIRATLVQESKDKIKEYQDFVATNSVIADLDSNPFVPLAIQKTLTSTLATIAAVVH